MRNIEHVIGHFGNPNDHTGLLNVNGHFTRAAAALEAVERAVEHKLPITLDVATMEPRHAYSMHGSHQTRAYIKTCLYAPPGFASPNIPTLERLIRNTALLLAEWEPGVGYECPIDPACNAG